MKKLKVDIAEIAELMEMGEHEDQYYLDLQAGKTVIIPSDLISWGVDGDDDDSDSDDDGDGDASGLPYWEKELLPIAKEIDAGSERYASIPEIDSWEAYDDMVRFATSITDAHLREVLDIALRGKGAFRRFKDALYNHPQEQSRWYAFKENLMVERVRDWLAEIGIEPVEGKSTD